MRGVLVKTGKYPPETHEAASGTPDHAIDSFADLPTLVRELRGPAQRHSSTERNYRFGRF
ncbi:HAD hydrolase-like protein [Streptomyces sp. NPDC003697]